MRLALEQAQEAAAQAEVPVGAVLVQPDASAPQGARLLAQGHNRSRQTALVHTHAELEALAMAQRAAADYRLDATVLYVTVEPCLMCLGALHQSRLARVVFGCNEPKFGALSRFGLAGHPALARLELSGGLLADEASALLGSFFRRLRGSA